MTGPEPSGGGIPWTRRILLPAFLVVLIGAVYAPTLDAEFVVWDDDDHIYENRGIVSDDGYWEAWRNWRDPIFYPATFTTWWVEWRLAGGQPWLFHLDNVLLHAGNALLLGLLLRWLGLRYALAWALAGVWALHPQQVESVAWATERKNLLYVAFYLGATLVYARSVRPDRPLSAGAWWAALALALASLSSKATAVTLPITLALTHWVRGAPFDRRAALRLGSFFLLSVAVGLVHVSREQVVPALDLGERLLVAARATWFYALTFLWPTDLVAVYPRWAGSELVRSGGLSVAALAAAASTATWFARRIPPLAWWGVGVYLVNIALVVGVVWFGFMGYSFVADHFVYLAAVGLALVYGLAADAVLTRLAAPRSLHTAVGAGVWILLAALSWNQTALWENTEALWTRTLAVNPESRLAHKNLGVYLMERDRPDEARRHFEEVLRLESGDVEALLNLGVLASNEQDWPRAVSYYQETLRRGAYPALVLNNLGIAAASTGDPATAIGFYEQSLEHDPADAKTWMNLAAARLEVGDVEGAIRDDEKSLALNPRSAETHFNLALALHRAGRSDEAVGHYEEAHRLDPGDVDTLYNLGVVLMELERFDEARDRLQQALAREPTNADAVHNLGAIALARNDPEAAVREFTRAHELAPGDVDTTEVLATLLYRGREVGPAIAVLERTLEVVPEEPRVANQLAWIRATCPLVEWRDPEAAVRLARVAVAQVPDGPAYRDTLAAALAAAGRFEEARAEAERALELTPADTPLATERARRRDLYEAGRPFSTPAARAAPPDAESS